MVKRVPPKGTLINANLAMLGPSTVIDVGPHGSGKSTRLAKWLSTPSPVERIGFTHDRRAAANLMDLVDDMMQEMFLNGSIPVNKAHKPPVFTLDEFESRVLSRMSVRAIEIGIDGFDRVTMDQSRRLSMASIGYVTITGTRPYTDDRIEYQKSIAAKLRRLAKSGNDPADVNTLLMAANMLDEDTSVTDLIAEIEDGWEIDEDNSE